MMRSHLVSLFTVLSILGLGKAAPTDPGLTVCSAQDPSTFPLSCSTSSPGNTCCTESPGGHLLLTEFWNTGADSVGPNTTWTVHGLWPGEWTRGDDNGEIGR